LLGRRPKLKFETAEYSVEIQVLFRENRQIVYRENGRTVDFGAEAVGPDWDQLNAMVPAGIEATDRDRIVANVAGALSQMGYEYVIFERGEKEAVLESERELAKNRLRDMGFEASVLSDEQVKLTRTPGSQSTKKQFTPQDGIEMMKWVSALRETRSTPKVLVKSKSAR
jgi:hypothetical protein